MRENIICRMGILLVPQSRLGRSFFTMAASAPVNSK